MSEEEEVGVGGSSFESHHVILILVLLCLFLLLTITVILCCLTKTMKPRAVSSAPKTRRLSSERNIQRDNQTQTSVHNPYTHSQRVIITKFSQLS